MYAPLATVLLLALTTAAAPASDASSIDRQTGLPTAKKTPPAPSPSPSSTRPTTTTPTPTPTPTPTISPSRSPQTTPIAPPSRSTGRRPPGSRNLEGNGEPQLIDSPEFEYDSTAPFATEPLALSDVLKVALETNVDLA
ncbi:MAG TPA: hypothetical protein ENK31_01310, partial [Nannocystis exedens]|nr:hypothetical protein [Nannocystis exedens]